MKRRSRRGVKGRGKEGKPSKDEKAQGDDSTSKGRGEKGSR